MSCERKLYTDANINIPIFVSKDSEPIDINAVTRVTVDLVSVAGKSLIKQYDSDTGGIEVKQDSWVIKVKEGDVTTRGLAYVKIIIYEGANARTRLTPCPDQLQFVDY